MPGDASRSKGYQVAPGNARSCQVVLDDARWCPDNINNKRLSSHLISSPTPDPRVLDNMLKNLVRCDSNLLLTKYSFSTMTTYTDSRSLSPEQKYQEFYKY